MTVGGEEAKVDRGKSGDTERRCGDVEAIEIREIIFQCPQDQTTKQSHEDEIPEMKPKKVGFRNKRIDKGIDHMPKICDAFPPS